MFVLRFIIIVLMLISSPLCFSNNHGIDSRVNFLGKLINTSSGARQVIKSNDPEVSELYLKAKSLFSQAKEQFDLDNNSQGSALLDQSVKTMFTAIRRATPVSLGNNKLKHDFDKYKKSVNALSKAFNRIADEQKNYTSKEKINSQLDKILARANKLIIARKYAPAKTELDKAYHLLKVSIESLRDGQTLVRSLNFATPKEEYHYELDRNNTHKMLIKILLDGKDNSAYTKKMIMKFTQKAKSLGILAEQAAHENNFEQAIGLLEQSTKQLVRAIRSAGIYIPG